MVRVQKLAVARFHQRYVDRVQIDRNPGQIFKFHELTKFILHILHTEHQILRPDAKFSFQIKTRLIRGNHTFLQNRIFSGRCEQPPSDGIRALMHTAQIADAMPCSVIEIHAVFPQEFARYIVQIDTPAAIHKLRIQQTQHRARHQRTAAFFFLRDRSDRDGTRHIRRSLIILSAGIDQIQPLLRYTTLLCLRRRIMAHRRVRSPRRDRRKAHIQAVFLFQA